VLTSDNEAMPYSLVEAALAGLPTVTTNAGSASEVVVDGVTGYVVPLSPVAVARAVQHLVSDPESMASMGAAARERALVEFSPQRMLAEHTAAYEKAIASRR
jgi:glycosyltransferase involved in cell wall biosynthesis